VAFTTAYCQSPICTPSRASFLTGKYPSAIHVNTNGKAYFPPHETLVTRRLADAGYDCGLVGKLHLAGPANGREPRVDDGYRSFCSRSASTPVCAPSTTAPSASCRTEPTGHAFRHVTLVRRHRGNRDVPQ
jgi:arylsulfatase